MSAVLVTHPHVAAVSAGLAKSLAAEGKLAGYYTGVAVAEDGPWGALAARMARLRPVLNNRIVPGIPPSRLHSFAPVEIAARLLGRAFASSQLTVRAYDSIFMGHDLAVSLAPWPRETTTVYAYEDGALRTFRRAARSDLERVLDFPPPHHLATEEIMRAEERRWPDASPGRPHQEPDWKKRRKDAELALATKISVASAFTRQSLSRLGLSVPVVVAPYGFPVENFPARTARPQGRFRVVSVGAQDLRKGTPYLLEAWRRAQIPDAELHLIGPLRLAKSFVDRYAGLFQHHPHIPKRELPAHYAAADVLAFPTVGDGFGLVIQEAMCCGTPVITTPCGGGPECITNGVDGWLIPARDIDALIHALRQCAADRDRTYAVGLAARARAEKDTWREAGAATIRALAF